MYKHPDLSQPWTGSNTPIGVTAANVLTRTAIRAVFEAPASEAVYRNMTEIAGFVIRQNKAIPVNKQGEFLAIKVDDFGNVHHKFVSITALQNSPMTIPAESNPISTKEGEI